MILWTQKYRSLAKIFKSVRKKIVLTINKCSFVSILIILDYGAQMKRNSKRKIEWWKH